ncbi:MAG: T9SS type A sorting domain-containing protein [Fibrobacterota bacterium]
MKKITLLGLFFVLTAYALNVPITVKEALPANVTSGFVRTSEPVRLGVPLLDAEAISSVSNLTLQGISDYQFRVMERYASGNIRWLCVDFPASVSANDSVIVNLLDNGSPSSTQNLATESDSFVTINTGALQALISKKKATIIEQLSAGGVEYISRGNAGALELLDQAGALFSSTNNNSSGVQVVLEENGPFHAVVKIDAKLYNTSGSVKMHCGLRLHFFKDKAYLKAALTLKNDLAANSITAFKLRGMQWRLSTTLSSAPAYALSGTSGTVSGSVGSDVYVLQGQSNFRAGNYSGAESRWISSSGYEIKEGATTQQAFGTTAQYAYGRAEVTDGGKKVSLGFFQLSGNFGAGMTLKPGGDMCFDVLSPHKDSTFNFSYFAYETREFMVGFGSAITAQTLETLLNYPLLGRVPFDRYRATGAFLYQTRLASYSETVNFYKGIGGVAGFSMPHPSETGNMAGNTFFSRIGPFKVATSSGGGPSGNLVFNSIYLLRYLQTGWGGYYLLTKNFLDGLIDENITHSYDFNVNTLGASNSIAAKSGDEGNTMNGPGLGYKTYVEGEHPHWLSVIPWYYITADERIKENWTEFVEYRKWNRWMINDWNPPTKLNVDYTRWYTYDFRDAVVSNWLSPGLDANLQNWVARQINTEASDADHRAAGWDPNRGFWIDGAATAVAGRTMHSFFFNEKHAENLGNVYDILGANSLLTGQDSLRRKLRDRLTGFGHFDYVEMYADWRAGNIKWPGAGIWCWYDYGIDSTTDDNDEGYSYISDATFLAAFAFDHTGDTTFLTNGALIPKRWSASCGTEAAYGTPSALRLIYEYTNRDKVKVGYPALNVVDQGSGTYTLSWTQPSDPVTEYVLKYSTKTIVVRNDYNRRLGTYQFPIASNVPFWSASEYLAAAIPPEAVSVNVTGLTTGLNFKLQYISDQTLPTTSIEKKGVMIPGNPGLEISVSPNPFTTCVMLKMKGAEATRNPLQCDIYDVNGRRITRLLAPSAEWASGVAWKATDRPAGIYLARIKKGEKQYQKKIILLK